MQDSVDIKVAADRLQSALKSLEGALDPLVARVVELEQSAREAGDFETDRANLARRLDETTANIAVREKEFEAREAEFSALANETTEELDRVIRQVKHVLGRE